MNWSFDFGANPNQEKLILGQKSSLVKVPGNNNLTIDIENETILTFIMDVNNEKAAILHIYKN